MKINHQYSFIATIALVFLFLAMPAQAATVDIGDIEPAARTVRYRTNPTPRIKSIVETTVIMATACTFLASVMYWSVMHELDRHTLHGTEAFGAVVQGMRRYGWCYEMDLHPQSNLTLLAFSCFLATGGHIADLLANAWGNQTVDTAWHAAPIETALHRTGPVNSLITVDDQGAVESIRTYNPTLEHHECPLGLSGNCIKAEFRPGQHPAVKAPSFFHRALHRLFSGGRRLLQTEDPMNLMNQHVQGDAVMHDGLVEAFQAFGAQQCPDVGDLAAHMHEVYRGVLHEASAERPNVAVDLWYHRAGGKVALSRAQSQFVAWQAQGGGNSTCNFHSNHTLSSGADAQLILAPSGMHLHVGKRVLDMLAPTVTEELTKSDEGSESPSVRLSESRTMPSTRSLSSSSDSLTATDLLPTPQPPVTPATPVDLCAVCAPLEKPQYINCVTTWQSSLSPETRVCVCQLVGSVNTHTDSYNFRKCPAHRP